MLQEWDYRTKGYLTLTLQEVCARRCLLGFEGLSVSYPEATTEQGRGGTHLRPEGRAPSDFVAPVFAFGSKSREVCNHQTLSMRRTLSGCQ